MLTLDQLASRWLAPEREEDFSLPALAGPRGMVQAAWGVAGIRNWIVPPTGFPTPTAELYHEEVDGRIRRVPREGVRYRWRAYELEREGHGVRSRLRLAPDGALLARLRFDEAGIYHLVFDGLPRVWRFTDYWNLPPWDVPQLNARRVAGGLRFDDTKTFGEAEFLVPSAPRIDVFRDRESWRDGARPIDRGTIGVARLEVRAGDEVAWTAAQGCDGLAAPRASAWEEARSSWEHAWSAAFEPDDPLFSGHLPVFEGELERLYSMSVLTALMCRRELPRPTARAGIATGGQCIWNAGAGEPLETAWVWGGPEGGMTTLFLWELEFLAPLLARLDPQTLRNLLDAMLGVDLSRHWGLETVSGAGAGMAYGVNPGAVLSIVRDYVRITGDHAFARAREDELRRFLRPELTDYGTFENCVECVSTWEHGVAAFNAQAVQGLRFFGELTGEPGHAERAAALAGEVLGLYADGPFACVQPDGTRRVVRTVLDFVYVGRCMTDDLPSRTRRGMVEFFERELRTPDWLRALSASDDDAATARLPSFQRYRADHQSTGSYDGWPARAASVLLRFGERERALEWLRAIQELTHEGPFGQAHFVHEDGARKASFVNGNCYFNAAPAAYAVTLLEDLGTCDG